MDNAGINSFTVGGLTLYEIIWFFLIYSFIGWVLEVIYNAAAEGHVVNRGFLNGPVCPIYGFGMVGLLALAGTFFPGGAHTMNAVLIFLVGMVLATAVELFGGWALDKLFHARWWDYSDKPFNLNGYICPQFSLLWGIGAVLVLRVFHPFIKDITVDIWPKEVGWPVASILCLMFAADAVLTVMIVIGLNKELAELDDIKANMRKVSDDLSTVLGTGSIKTVQRMEEGRLKAELARADLLDQAKSAHGGLLEQAEAASAQIKAHTDAAKDALDAKSDEITATLENKKAELLLRKEELLKKQEALYNRLLSGKVFGPLRLFRAFPDLKMPDHKDLLEDIKARLKKINQ